MFKKFTLTTWIVIGMVCGIIAGLVFGPVMGELKFIGDIFLRLIQMSVVLLVMGAVIEAVGSIKPRELGRLGGKTVIGFMITTFIAATIGIILANTIKPGAGIPMIELETEIKPPDSTFIEMLVNFFPTNIINAMANANMIQVIVFAMLFGLALSIIGKSENENKIIALIKDFNAAILSLVKIVMKMAPIGIFALLGWVTGTIGIIVIIPLAKFLIAMAIGSGLMLLLFITLVSIYGKINPIRLARKFYRMALVAFTTTSSAITLPVKMADAENLIGISKRVSRLVNPLGMSINSDGLALYLALACITIGQFFDLNLTLTQQVTIVVMSVLATLGTVVVPGGGLVALAIVLPAVGLPLEGIAILAGIDWFSGMFRTVMNVIDDVIIALFVAISEGEFDRDIFMSDEVSKAPDSINI